MTKEKLHSIFSISGIPIIRVWELPNNYWPSPILTADSDERDRHDFIRYQSLRLDSPWWLVKTSIGMIEIGWRKRVIRIDWSDTDIRGIVTEDQTTKSESMVHAWNELDAIKYLQALSKMAT